MIINDKNKTKIEALIKEAEGKSRERCISYQTILRCVELIECKFDIPKCKMLGMGIHVDWHAQNFPRAYKYTPMSTHFYITRKPSGWNLESVYRSECKAHQFTVIDFPEETKLALLDSFMKF